MIESLIVNRKECYDDIIMSLIQGLLVKDDINVIIQHYEDLEQYECCQGILDAYNDYRKTKK